MSLQPLLTQLDNGTLTAGDDCAVMTLLNAVRWASHGRVGPQHRDEVDDWVRQVRHWAGKPRGGLLLRAETFKAYQHPDLRRAFDRAGLPPMRSEYHAGIGWATLGRRIVAGEYVHLAVHYGVLRAGNAPTGSRSFAGGHSIGLVGAHKVAHHLHVWDGDPLFDGRRKGIPDGWADARLLDFRRAAGAFGIVPMGAGKAYAIFVRRG